MVGGGWEAARYFGPPDPFNPGGFGHAIAAVGDLDGDGLSEIAVSAPQEVVPGLSYAGAVYLVSGWDGAVIWQSLGQVADEGFGQTLTALDDLNGDGFPEIGAGIPRDYSSGTTFDPGEVVILSGADGSRFRTHLGETSGSACSAGEFFGQSLASLDDLDGDGVDEYLIGAPYASSCSTGTERHGAVNLYHGRTGIRISRTLGSGFYEKLGWHLIALADQDGDGLRDWMAAAPGSSYSGSQSFEGGVKVYSSGSGVQLAEIGGTVPKEQLGQAAISRVGDLNGDGVHEIALSSALNTSGASWNRDGVVKVVDGVTGFLIWQLDGWETDQELGATLAPAGDLDLDGIPDLLIGSPGSSGWSGAVVIASGANGEVRWVAPAPNGSGAFGYALIGPRQYRPGRTPAFLANGHSGPHTGVFVLEFEPFLTADAGQVSASSGGTIQYQVDFPVSLATVRFALLASATGRGPTGISGFEIPLTPDSLFWRTANALYPSFLSGGAGRLDSNGDALAVLAPPPGALSAWQGRGVWVAAVAHASYPLASSVAVHLSIDP